MAAILDVSRQGTVSYVEDHCLRVTAMLKLALRRTLRGHCCASCSRATREQIAVGAGVAQLVEHLICNQRVGGSSPFASSSSSQQEKKDWIWLYCSTVLALQTSGHSFKGGVPVRFAG
jgi:hypothetical protein